MKIKKENLPSSLSDIRFLYNEVVLQQLKKNNINDLYASYGSIIFNLLKEDSIPMKDLADRIKRDKSTLTVLIKKLEKNGYVMRVQNKEDGRSRLLSLTSKGRALETVFTSISNELNEKLWSGIDEKEARIFLKCLNRVADNLIRILE